MLIAEAYWDMEWELQQQGFDFCYDKRLYDRIVAQDARGVREHLRADLDYQSKLLRFLENHDEPRIAARLGVEAEMAAAVAIATLPGGTLWHEGQFEGRRVRPPVFLSRRPDEQPNQHLAAWYRRLLATVSDRDVRRGRWQLLETTGWPDNQSCDNLLAWSWSGGDAAACGRGQLLRTAGAGQDSPGRGRRPSSRGPPVHRPAHGRRLSPRWRRDRRPRLVRRPAAVGVLPLRRGPCPLRPEASGQPLKVRKSAAADPGSRLETRAGRQMTTQPSSGTHSTSLRRVLVPLALAQFICSFAGSNMNVMITDISEDLDTTVQGVQIAITIFLLVMAALMIPAGKLTDRYGRKRCFTLGLVIYGVGAVISALSPGLGVLIIGNSILEGVGTALLIPPVYILTTLLFTDLTSRARAFGVISALGGIGAAAGPLIGGLITSAISWRAAFIFQALVIAVIIWLARGIKDPLPADPTRQFDVTGAVLSATGLVLVVLGILAADNNGWLMVALIVAGAVVLAAFFVSVRAKERAGKEPLLSTALFRNRTSNLGLVTQNTQWLLLMGVSFVVSAYLQVVRGYNAIQTGVIFTAATVGILVSSLAAERLAKRFPQRTLILVGFVVTIAGVGVLLFLVTGTQSSVGLRARPAADRPGARWNAHALGQRRPVELRRGQARARSPACREVCPTSAPPSARRSPAPSSSPASPSTPGRAYGLAMITLAAVGVIGLVAAFLLPRHVGVATNSAPIPARPVRR